MVSLSELLAKAVQRLSAVLRALRLLLVCVSEGQHTSDSLSLIVDECFLLTAYISRKHRGLGYPPGLLVLRGNWLKAYTSTSTLV